MIQCLWLAFTIIFFSFALYHFHRATKSFDAIPNTAKVKTFNGLPLGIGEFIDNFNDYIHILNKDNKRINIITGLAYLTASATALVSYFLVA